MSLLNSFQSDFNAKVKILKKVDTINTDWQPIPEYIEQDETITCFIFLNKFQENAGIKHWNNEIEAFKTSHKIRMPLWHEVLRGDKIKDQDWLEYEVKLPYKQPWFKWQVDHLLLFANIIDG